MKFVITVALLFLVYLGARGLIKQWGEVNSQGAQPQQEAYGSAQTATPSPAVAAAPAEGGLQGLPPHLESSLTAAKRQGSEALKIWLRTNRGAVQDPLLADIELDYAVLVAGKNFGEAQEVLAAVRARITEDSPVYEKLTKLEKSYR